MISKKLKELSKAYRPIPFWSWNDKLEKDELKRQIRQMHSAGMGGFFMHARGGLQTEYLSEEWFDVSKTCIDEAASLDMQAWCYDENGWPSGFAGMKLLEDSTNFAHFVTCKKSDKFDDTALCVYLLKDNKLMRVFSNINDADEYICIYDHVNSSVVDILNAEVVKKFIDLTHEKYYDEFGEEFGNKMAGFFTDEPQYFRWDTAYTPVLLSYFKNKYNEDILDNLGALFIDCDSAFEFRYKYWLAMNDLYVKNFAKQIYDWCEEHNCKLTGHSIEECGLHNQMWCCAGVMPFYEYEQVPGIDWLGRDIGTEIAPKQVSSVARQLGKKQVLTETFACTGWNVTPKELKLIAEWQYVNGVNLMCHHLYPYSIRGVRKHDHPTFFSEHNPWAKHLNEFNNYFTLLGTLLGESQEVVDTCVIHPMHSAYLTYKREDDYLSVKSLQDDFSELVEKLGAANIHHHYVDETILKRHGEVKNNKLNVGLCEYKNVIVPKMMNIDSSTLELLNVYAKNGGKLFFYGDAPMYVDGKKAEVLLKSNIDYEDLFDSYVEIDDKQTDIRSTLHKGDFGTFIYAVNLSKTQSYNVTYKIVGAGAKRYDLEKDKYENIVFTKENECVNVKLSFEPMQSMIIVIDDESEALSEKVASNKVLQVPFVMQKSSQNALTVDTAHISYDGVNFEKALPIEAICDRLLKERKNHVVYLKFDFNISDLPENIFLEMEPMNSECITINGQKLDFSQEPTLDKSFIRVDIADKIKIGINEITCKINYYQSDHVYYVLFDALEGTESLMNCLSYDTEPQPVYILGDFVVKSVDGFNDVQKGVTTSNGKFTVSVNEQDITLGSIVTKGYPFFAGEVQYTAKFEKSFDKAELVLTGEFAIAEVSVNSKKVANVMFNNRCDITDYLLEGTNNLTITLINSNRNIFGPFHCADNFEPLSVGPDSFSMRGTWKNGHSLKYRQSYSFVNFGLEKIEILFN